MKNKTWKSLFIIFGSGIIILTLFFGLNYVHDHFTGHSAKIVLARGHYVGLDVDGNNIPDFSVIVSDYQLMQIAGANKEMDLPVTYITNSKGQVEIKELKFSSVISYGEQLPVDYFWKR